MYGNILSALHFSIIYSFHLSAFVDYATLNIGLTDVLYYWMTYTGSDLMWFIIEPKRNLQYYFMEIEVIFDFDPILFQWPCV